MMNPGMNLDKFSVEAFLFSPDFGEDNYLLKSSSSDDSDEECICSCKADISNKAEVPNKTDFPDKADIPNKAATKRIKKGDGFVEAIVPTFNPDVFRNHFRVTRMTFEKIVEMIHTDYSIIHKGGWEKITPEKAAYVLLWYLGNRETFKQISDRFKITMSCSHNIIKTCTRNLSSRVHEHILWPSVREYPTIAQLFQQSYDLTNVIGAIGVTYMKIPKPKDRPESYMCKNNLHSIALQGTVTINKKFIHFYISEGSKEPGDLLIQSSVPQEANNGLLGNYFLLGDNAYPSYPWMMQPLEDDGNLDESQTHFNLCYDAGFTIVSETFGLLKGRFQRLQHIENRDISVIKQCVDAACVIHNLCIDCEEDEEDFFFDETALPEMVETVSEEIVDEEVDDLPD